MIHPATTINAINESIGCGVFATAFIPKGTIVYVQDKLDHVFKPTDKQLYQGNLRPYILKYSFTGPQGERVLSWDHAKYVNHCCSPNTRSTGYGFELAIRDILPGDEITDDYGMFMFEPEEQMDCLCGASNCRGQILADDIDRFANRWDHEVRQAIDRYASVAQPLNHFLPPAIRHDLIGFINGNHPYRSVRNLRPQPTSPRKKPLCA